MAFTSRGFGGRTRRPRDERLPPGQYDVGSDWPVLTAEVTPPINLDRWTFTLDGLVDQVRTWNWAELRGLPESRYEGDIHCVTTWSKLATNFTGVSVDTFLQQAQLADTASHVLVASSTGYTTNLPLDDVRGGKAWLVWAHEGKDLNAAHGGPVRLLVPHLYFWKSAKFVSRMTVLDHDEPGFWERNGYHDRGDPWLEQRYQGD
jgi:DMSO/TMAO reductase YedYZ molybdopterin-dependent catalytic subunit